MRPIRLGVKPSKYRAKPKTIGGTRFASQREANRYLDLLALLEAGQINGLELQPVYPLYVSSHVNQRDGSMLIGKYRADFRYQRAVLTSPFTTRMETVVEDVKGYDTPLSKWKRKHVKAQYGIDVVLV